MPESIQSLEIYWPTSDRTQVFRDVDVNQFIVVTEDDEEYKMRPYRPLEF